MEEEVEVDFKRSRRAGGWKALNVYVCNMKFCDDRGNCEATGLSARPQDIAPSDRWVDGVMIDPSLLREGSLFIHEVGHWLGLEHTFGGGGFLPDASCRDCSCDDGITDTPRHRLVPVLDCRPRDTCPNHPGLDPISNFMGYNNFCAHEFTPEQRARMWVTTLLYRHNPTRINRPRR